MSHPPRRVVLASGNRGKLAELERLLPDFEVLPQAELGVTDAIEDASSFVENALIKARHASLSTGLPAVADDSGLCVDALRGAPGLHSARYAGEPRDDQRNIDKLLDALAEVPEADRGCAFVSVVVWLEYADDPRPVIGEGAWYGRVLRERRGTGGFGYDPVFFDDALDLSAAELTPADKAALSHRGRAMRAMQATLRERYAEPGDGAGHGAS